MHLTLRVIQPVCVPCQPLETAIITLYTVTDQSNSREGSSQNQWIQYKIDSSRTSSGFHTLQFTMKTVIDFYATLLLEGAHYLYPAALIWSGQNRFPSIVPWVMAIGPIRQRLGEYMFSTLAEALLVPFSRTPRPPFKQRALWTGSDINILWRLTISCLVADTSLLRTYSLSFCL